MDGGGSIMAAGHGCDSRGLVAVSSGAIGGGSIMAAGHGGDSRGLVAVSSGAIADGNSGSHGAYNVQCRLGEIMYGSPRLIRGSSGWRYVGVTHELLIFPSSPGASPTLSVPDVLVVMAWSGHESATREKVQRWELDVLLLNQSIHDVHITKDHTNDRSVFYLARVLSNLGRLEESFHTFEQRVALGGWGEEVFESLYALGKLCQELGHPW